VLFVSGWDGDGPASGGAMTAGRVSPVIARP